MTGFYMVLGPCVACHRLFGFNPHLVPSIREERGERQPVCQQCVGIYNRRRAADGLPGFPIPPGAYEPVPEGEL